MFLHSRTRYQRNSNGCTYVFGDQLPIRTHENSIRLNRKWKKPIWRPLNLKYTFLHSRTRYQRHSNCYTYVFGVRLSIGAREGYCATKPEVEKSKSPITGNAAIRRGLTRARPAIEGKGGPSGGWVSIRHFLNHVTVSWWNEITIRLVRELQWRTKDRRRRCSQLRAW